VLSSLDILKIIGFIAAAIALAIVVRWRRRNYAQFLQRFADEEVCEHLRPALEQLKSRGHVVVRAGQVARDLPLEIHLTPGFDPEALHKELKLESPVFVSQRNVLYCEQDWCELKPVGPAAISPPAS
jgi:hypothetical protein